MVAQTEIGKNYNFSDVNRRLHAFINTERSIDPIARYVEAEKNAQLTEAFLAYTNHIAENSPHGDVLIPIGNQSPPQVVGGVRVFLDGVVHKRVASKEAVFFEARREILYRISLTRGFLPSGYSMFHPRLRQFSGIGSIMHEVNQISSDPVLRQAMLVNAETDGESFWTYQDPHIDVELKKVDPEHNRLSITQIEQMLTHVTVLQMVRNYPYDHRISHELDTAFLNAKTKSVITKGERLLLEQAAQRIHYSMKHARPIYDRIAKFNTGHVLSEKRVYYLPKLGKLVTYEGNDLNNPPTDVPDEYFGLHVKETVGNYLAKHNGGTLSDTELP